MKAWQLIEKEENWCQKAYAMAASGTLASPQSEFAVKWCPVGALAKCYQGDEKAYCEAYRALQAEVNGPITPWNSDSTHAQVLAAMKKADV